MFGKSREVKLKCKTCNGKTFTEQVEFGSYIKIQRGNNENTSCVELVKERPSRIDIFIKEIICPDCGCCNGLEFID